jgi:protein SCO1/2
MRFMLKDRAVLDELRRGDQVEGVLRVQRHEGAVVDYELIDLTVTKPAPPEPLVIEFAKGQAILREPTPRLVPGEAVEDFAMTGQDGTVFKLSDLRGSVVVLTFIYTRCPLPDFCPLMDRKFASLAQRLSASSKRAASVRLISLSFDPEHDTPEVLRAHARLRGATPPLWTFAVASHEELAKVAAPLGLFYGQGKGEITHNLCTAIIGPDGKLARLEIGSKSNQWDAVDFLKTIDSLISGS